MDENSGKKTNVRWVIAVFMWAAMVINYLDRTVMSAAAPAIMKDFQLSPTEMGVIMSAFFWSYAAFQIPAGWLADKIGQRITFACAVLWWSLATAATAMSRATGGLIGARLFMGAGEAAVYPCNTGITAKWFPDHERGRVSAFFDSGTKFGTAFTMPLVAWMVSMYGWEIPFVICGAIGVLWVIAWMGYYKDPEQHKAINALELKYIRDGQAKKEGIDKTQPMKWYELLKHRNIIAMCLGFFLFNYAMFFFITWFPTYLVKERGIQMMSMGYSAMLPPLTGILAQWAGGILLDYTYQKTGSLTFSRKLNLGVGLFAATSIAFAGLAQSNTIAIALLCVSYGGLAFAASSIWALAGDIAPRNMTSVLTGIQNCASNIGGILGPIVTGYIITMTGSFILALAISGTACLISALIYIFGLGKVEPMQVPNA